MRKLIGALVSHEIAQMPVQLVEGFFPFEICLLQSPFFDKTSSDKRAINRTA